MVLVWVVSAIVVSAAVRLAARGRSFGRGTASLVGWSVAVALLVSPHDGRMLTAGLAGLITLLMEARSSATAPVASHPMLARALQPRAAWAAVAGLFVLVSLATLNPFGMARSAAVAERGTTLPDTETAGSMIVMTLVVALVGYLALRRISAVADPEAAVEGANLVVRCMLGAFAATAVTLVWAWTDPTATVLLGLWVTVTAVAVFTRPNGLRAADAQRRLAQQRQDAQVSVS